MRISIYHVPTGKNWTSDYLSGTSIEEITDIVARAMKNKLSHLRVTIEKNDVYIPSKILSDCTITIIQ